jgi:cell division protein FtsL
MPTPQIPMTFNNVAKSPYTYLLITIVSLLWYFVYNNSSINQQNDQDCKQVTTELRNQLKDERKKNDDLINTYSSNKV